MDQLVDAREALNGLRSFIFLPVDFATTTAGIGDVLKIGRDDENRLGEPVIRDVLDTPLDVLKLVGELCLWIREVFCERHATLMQNVARFNPQQHRHPVNGGKVVRAFEPPVAFLHLTSGIPYVDLADHNVVLEHTRTARREDSPSYHLLERHSPHIARIDVRLVINVLLHQGDLSPQMVAEILAVDMKGLSRP